MYNNEYGNTQFSLDTFILDGTIGEVTEKYGRRTIKVDVNNTNLLEVLENEGVKTYGNSVFVDIGFQTAIDQR